MTKRKNAIQGNLVAQGMLIYSAINSTGYFAQRGQWVFMLLFFTILGFSLLSVNKLLGVETKNI